MSNDETSELLRSGKAFADLSYWRQVAVSGADALEWLDDLVTADLSDLAPGRARHALFLAPTGGVRASLTVAVPGEGLLLVQDPTQPRAIEELLEPFILSSDVAVEDRTGELAIFAFPGQEAVAKVDALGHPRRLVLALEADGPASPGDAVLLDGSEVGEITSSVTFGDRTLLLARLRWEARDGRLRTGLGTELGH